MATYGLLHPKYIFGVNADCKGTNVYYLDANTIVYPAGNTVVIYNIDQKTQSFIHGVEKGNGITALTVSNIKVHVAVASYGDADKPASIAIFDLKLNKRRKTLQFPSMISKEYISLAFTHDCLHLASLTGAPEYVVVFWKWEKSRMLCQAKTTGSMGPVYEISTSPAENNVMCAVGKSSFRFFRYNEGHIKPFGFQRGDAYHFLCHAWLGKGDRLIAGTAEGRLMFFERGEYRYDIPVPTELLKPGESLLMAKKKNAKKLDPIREGFHGRIEDLVGTFGAGAGDEEIADEDQGSRPSTPYERKDISALVAYSKGFAVGHGSGNVIVYEEQLVYETPEEHYKHIHIIRIPPDTSDANDRVIRGLSINPTEEIIIATTVNSQIFYFALASAEIKEPNEMLFEYASCGFHYGAIIALGVAIRKSLFVTAGADKFIRVWNYVAMTQEAAKEEDEDIFCISFHPTGLFILAALMDKIRIYTILMDDIREVKDFHIRGVKECAFSNGGHLLAAGSGNVVQVYTTTSYENTHNLKGHSNKIRRLKWSIDDTKLISVGSDGAIYEWDLSTSRKSADYVERGSNMIDTAISPDTKTQYAITALKFIKEIQMQDGVLLKELNLGIDPKCITMSRSGKVLVAGMEGGIVRSFRQPLTYANEWFDFHMHVDSINAIQMTFDEVYCISAAEDGAIILWKVTDPEGRVSKMEKDVSYSSEVLITRSDLEDRDMAMRELRQRFGELRLEMEYQVKRKEMAFLEEMKTLNANFNGEISELNLKIDELIDTKLENDGTYHEHVEQMALETKSTIQNIEAHFNARLIAEFEKFNALQNLLEDTIQDYESRITTLDNERSTTIDEMVEYFEGKLKDKNSALEQSYSDSRNTMAESEEMKKQIEEDADEEILQLRHSYETKLIIEKELNGKLKAEAGIMRKNFAAMQKEIEEQKAEVQRLLHEGEKMKTVISITEKEVSTLRKDLVDRDVNVLGKEKVIFDLKKTNNELEKFKFVLDYKIKELKKLIEPKEREIIYLKQQNQDMENELDTTIAIRNGLELQVNELTNKLRVTDHEYQTEKRLRWRLNILVGRIRSHLSRCMGLLQDHHALKNMVKAAYAKYGHTLIVGKASNAEQEAICELVRQKNHLEMCLTSMKRKMSKDVDFTRTEQLKIMHENMLLVYEINNLRRELKLSRDRIQTYEVTLGVMSSSKSADQAEMRARLQHAVQDKDTMTLAWNKEVEAKDNMIEAQQFEIDSLANKIYKVTDFVNEIRPDTAPAASVDFLRGILSEDF